MNKIDTVLFAESKLLSALQKKSIEKSSHNDYVELFLNFKKRVCSEARFIVQNFPEYTPHDEEYHLRRLITIADDILGERLISALNATELLLLSLSIFGHDWGMAVSQAEKTQVIDSSVRTAEFALLPTEDLSFIKHLGKFNETAANLSDFAWQEYIRLTHAERSAERVREYFEQLDPGIGETTARICVGHWLDFKDIRDVSNYPGNYVVRGESVNLRAVTIYLRLIDLFDISNERTPYVIYKYTAPQSMRSKMEWAKHQAIHSLATTSYQSGRMIQVDGQTGDYKVFAALEDLHSFCLQQLQGCNELLQDLHEPRYNLNIFDVKWNIKPIGFDPISIKFEFDRGRMFEVLSEEIYKGDKYVFVRELLQNCIDAIKLRKEWIEKKTKLTLASFGEIRVNVNQTSKDIIEVTFTDDGIGMDRYIIENYLSVAGKSYYSSEEFKRLGLVMDPISKFGVGILSCFMVADTIQIHTFRDQMIKPDAKVLKVEIPYVDQQFRISATDPVEEKPGTCILVAVSREKIKSRLNDEYELDITGYLKKLVGFVEFPIVITEHSAKTVIINPFEDSGFYSKKYPGFEIYQLDTVLQFSKVFLPQSLKLAKENFKTKRFTLEGDLDMDGVVGAITYVIPNDPFLKIRQSRAKWPTTDYSLVSPEKRSQDRKIKIDSDWSKFSLARMPSGYRYGASSYAEDAYKVYLDGILIPKADPPEEIEGAREPESENRFEDYYPDEQFMVPFVIAKFSKRIFGSIDLSRTELGEMDISWDGLIAKKLFVHIIAIHKSNLLADDLKHRTLYFTYLLYYYRVPIEIIIQEIGIENCPVVTIVDGGIAKFRLWGEFIGQEIYIQPEFSYWFKQAVLKAFDENHQIDPDLVNSWSCGEFLAQDILYSELDEDYTSSSQVVLAAKFFQSYIEETHDFHSYRFISSPCLDGPPLIQPCWVPREIGKSRGDESLILSAAKDIVSIIDVQLESLIITLFDKLSDHHFDVFPEIGVFRTPYKDCMAYGIGILNFEHPFTKGLLRILACIQIYEENKKEVLINWANLIDKVLELPFFDAGTYFYTKFSLVETNLVIKEINSLIQNGRLIEGYITLPEVKLTSFVDNTVIDHGRDNYYQFFNSEDLSDYDPDTDFPYVLT